MSTFSYVSELHPNNENGWIYVQIIRMWKSDIAAGRHTVELVLCDHIGDKIQASICEDLVPCYEYRLKEGYWKILENFSVIFTSGSYRTTKHACKIEFNLYTCVRVCDFFPCPRTGFNPVDFRDILSGKENPNYLVDVIGQIVGVSLVEIVTLNGRDTEKITLELRNQYDDRLTVHMWGKYAIHGSGAISNLNRDNLNICVLRFVKISVFKDRSVSTAYDVSEVLIKPEMVEAEAFLKLLNKHDTHINLLPWNPVCLLPEIGEKIKFFTPVPMKTISEVFETKKAERCIVYCSIAAIDYDINWYYMSCKCCGKKVPSPPRYLMLYGNNLGDDSQKYYCSNCDMFGPELQPRYSIQLVVLDNTRDTKFLLLDRIAEKLLGVPCHVLTGPLTDEIKDPVFVHEVLSQLVRETYFFKIVIEKENVLHYCHTYQVLDIIPHSEMIEDYGLYRKVPWGTHKTIETEYSAQNGNQNKYTDAQQLGYSEKPTKFIYDGQLKAWKKRSGYRKATRSSLTKKIKTDKSG